MRRTRWSKKPKENNPTKPARTKDFDPVITVEIQTNKVIKDERETRWKYSL